MPLSSTAICSQFVILLPISPSFCATSCPPVDCQRAIQPTHIHANFPFFSPVAIRSTRPKINDATCSFQIPVWLWSTQQESTTTKTTTTIPHPSHTKFLATIRSNSNHRTRTQHSSFSNSTYSRQLKCPTLNHNRRYYKSNYSHHITTRPCTIYTYSDHRVRIPKLPPRHFLHSNAILHSRSNRHAKKSRSDLLYTDHRIRAVNNFQFQSLSHSHTPQSSSNDCKTSISHTIIANSQQLRCW